MEDKQYSLVNAMPADVLKAIDIEACDVINDLLCEDLWQKYLAITRENKIEAEGISMWQSVEEPEKYVIQVEFKDFDEALYIPANREQLNLERSEVSE